MKSPAQRHIERVSARGTGLAEETSLHHRHKTLMQAKLATDRQRLKGIQSLERKLAVKKEIVPEYEDYVAGVLEGKPGVQDEVLVSVMVWCIDIHHFDTALAIAEYALQHGLVLPSHYERTLATFVTEEIAQAALASGNFSVRNLERLLVLVDSHDMPDPVRAKLHKALGIFLQHSDIPAALTHLHRALSLHTRCGVKKEIDRLEREQITQAPRQNGASEQ